LANAVEADRGDLLGGPLAWSLLPSLWALPGEFEDWLATVEQVLEKLQRNEANNALFHGMRALTYSISGNREGFDASLVSLREVAARVPERNGLLESFPLSADIVLATVNGDLVESADLARSWLEIGKAMGREFASRSVFGHIVRPLAYLGR